MNHVDGFVASVPASKRADFLERAQTPRRPRRFALARPGQFQTHPSVGFTATQPVHGLTHR